MALFAGIDCGTQGTKVVIVDDYSGRILGEGSAPHPLISEVSGRRERQAQWWVDALIRAFKRAVDAAAVDPADIQGLSATFCIWSSCGAIRDRAGERLAAGAARRYQRLDVSEFQSS